MELAQSCQKSIEGLYTLAAEIARFYGVVGSLFPYFFDVLFGTYAEGLFLSGPVSRISSSWFNPAIYYYAPSGSKASIGTKKEEDIQPKGPTPFIPFQLTSALDHALTSNISEPVLPVREIGGKTVKPMEKAPENGFVFSAVRWQAELKSKIASSLESIRLAILKTEGKYPVSKHTLSTSSSPKPEVAPRKKEIEPLSEKKPEKTPSLYSVLLQNQLVSLAHSRLQKMLAAYNEYQRLELPLFNLANSNVPFSTISVPLEAPSEEKTIRESPLTETSAFWGKTQEIQSAAVFAARAKEIAAAMQTVIGLAVITHSLNFVPKPETIKPAEPHFKTISPKEYVASLVKSLPAKQEVGEKLFSAPKELPIEEEPSQGVGKRVELSSGTVASLTKSAELSNLIFESQLPFFKIAAALSHIFASPETVSYPIQEASYTPPTKISPPAPMPQPQISLLLREIAPSLTSWIYEGSEVLRKTGVPLSAVPIAASEAEKIVSETLSEPTPRKDASQPTLQTESSTAAFMAS